MSSVEHASRANSYEGDHPLAFMDSEHEKTEPATFNIGLALDTIHRIDALEGLKKLHNESVDCVMTSPPYWAMRDYGLPPVVWGGDDGCDHDFATSRTANQDKRHGTDGLQEAGRPDTTLKETTSSVASAFCMKCRAWRGSLGLELDYELYLDHLAAVFADVHRVLKTTGTLWVNLADTYAGSWGNYGQSDATRQRRAKGVGTSWRRRAYDDSTFRPPSSQQQGVPRRSLCLIPARLVIRMAKQGWILRNDIVWHKPNHMPASVKNRFACSWEHLFFFVKSEKYFFDLDAVRVPHKSLGGKRFRPAKHVRSRMSHHLNGSRMCPNPGEPQSFHAKGKNPGDFWTIPSETRKLGAILGISGAVKVPGGMGWTGHPPGGQARIVRELDPRWLPPKGKNPGDSWDIATTPFRGAHFAVYPESLCERPIRAGCPAGGIVLDPFAGSGTTAVVAKRFGRRFLGFELNPNYVQTACTRLCSSVAGQS